MKKDLTTFGYLLKDRLRTKDAVFWTMLYPIILISIFYFGFSGLMNEKFDPVKVGIDPNYQYIKVFEEVDAMDARTMDREEAEDLLRKEELTAFIQENGELLFLGSGTSQTLVKEITDWITQVNALIESGASYENLQMERNYIEVIQQKEDYWKLTYYAAVGMITTYSVYGGMNISSQTSPRIAVSPLKKSTRILCYFWITILINFFTNIALIFYIERILRLGLFPRSWESFVLITCGNFFGVAMGILLGLPKKISDGAKTGIASVICWFLAFFAGMLGRDVPRMLSKSVPWFEKVNPIAIISNNLMRVNMLSSTGTYGQGILILLTQTVILLIAGILILKTKKCECDQ